MRLLLFSLLLPGCLGLFSKEEEDTSPGLLEDKDVDADGFKVDVDDCDDTNAAINPDASEVCDTLGTDEDCDGLVNDADPSLVSQFVYYRDADGDGYGDYTDTVAGCTLTAGYAAVSGDCDDSDPDVNPAAVEVCDDEGIDDDCNGVANDDDPNVDPTGQLQASPDDDGDGFGTLDGIELYCRVPPGWSAVSTDCDDDFAGINPDAIEICDNADDDCDGLADEDDATDAATWYADLDGDGYGDAALPRLECDQPEGFVADATDCDDSRLYVSPEATESCNDTDDDCDGSVDEDARDATTWYADADADGYGDNAITMRDCDQPAGYIFENTDCDDADSAINPSATEICDAADTDEDCDGATDDGDLSVSSAGMTTYYDDDDADGYGDPDAARDACDLPSGYTTNDTDCDDTDAAINPTGTEVCDRSDDDEDCDGQADDDDSSVSAATRTTFYRDADGDGYGTSGTTTSACDAPSGYAATSTDCDDTTATRDPGNTEVCDASNTDEDCDSLADDADPSTSSASKTSYYVDADLDGYGTGSAVLLCDAVAGYATTSNDCDDSDAGASPAESEVCLDAVDDDCDGVTRCILTTADAERELIGDASYDYAGMDVAGNGDFDNDGYMDVLVGAPGNNRGGGDYGSAFLVRGGVSGDLDLSLALAYVPGDTASDGAGYGVAFVGDTNSDGYDDFVVGLPGDTSGGSAAGKVLFVRGTGSLSGTLNRLTAYATWTGAANDTVGNEVADAGDVNGDGLDDIIVGAEVRGTNAGGAYLLTAQTSGTSTFSTAAAATLTGESTYDYAGCEVDGAGDFNGDGYDDVIIGAYGDDHGVAFNAGAAYIVFGPETGSHSLSTADWKVEGETSSDDAGTFVAGGGDANGDGYDDVLVTADYNSGTVYLFTGRTTTGSANLSTSIGRVAGVGASGAGEVDLGDLDGDGTAEVLVGDPTYSSSTGRAFVFVGSSFSGSLTTSDADIVISGEASSDQFGASVAFIGDHDGDGMDDFVIGSPYNNDGSSDSGAAWVYVSSLW